MKSARSPFPIWLRLLVGLALSILSYFLLLYSQPPYGFWPLLLVGFMPMLLAQHRIFPARLSSLAPAITVGAFLGMLIKSIYGSNGDNLWFIQALPIFIGLIVLVTEGGTLGLNKRTCYRWFVLQGALGWVAIEMIRNLIPVLGTGGFVAYAFYRAPWLIQPLSIFGIFGLSLLAMIIAYTLGLAGIALFDRWQGAYRWQDNVGSFPVDVRLLRGWLTGAGIAFTAWTALSLVLYLLPADSQTLRVAAVQPGAHVYSRYISMARQAAEQGAQLIVFPEGALKFDPQVEKTAELQALARETRAYLVFGVGIRSLQGLRNEAVVISPDGEFIGVYGKDHPMTYLGETSLSRGQYPVYTADFGRIATIICFDLNFNDTSRRLGKIGAQLLAVPSNDWPALATRQIAYLTFRAVENRVAAVKADSRYDSMVIDARGHVIQAHLDPHGSQHLLIADVALGTSYTLYQVLGDWIGWVSLAGLAFFSLPNPFLDWPERQRKVIPADHPMP